MNNKLIYKTKNQKEMKNLCNWLLILILIGTTACKDDNTPVELQAPVFELTDSIGQDRPVIVVPGETCQIKYLAEHINSITADNVPEGWQVNINEETTSIGITAPSASENVSKTFSLQLTAQGENRQTVTLSINFYLVTFDDPKGTFVLNEGNMTSENGSLLYITAEGYIVDNVYKRVNGTELGNVPQDMCQYNGKTYIISQNGNGNAMGAESDNDGMLVITDTRTLKKLKSYPKETLSPLDWPTHIAVIDEEHIYIRDNAGIWRMNENDASLTFIKGSEEAPKAPFAIVNGKVYTYYNQNFMTGLYEITPGNDQITNISVPFYSLYGITGIASAPDNCLWIMSTKFGGEISMNRYNPATQEDLERNYISEVPSVGSSGCAFAAHGNTIYYASGTTIYRLDFRPDIDQGNKTPQDEILTDLSLLDEKAQIMYNGLGVNPTTGYVYANTLKGVGPFYTTNQLWVFDFAGSTGTPLFKFENYTRFPAGFFFIPCAV